MIIFANPSTRQLHFSFCYPQFVGDARMLVGHAGDVENDAGDVDGLE